MKQVQPAFRDEDRIDEGGGVPQTKSKDRIGGGTGPLAEIKNCNIQYGGFRKSCLLGKRVKRLFQFFVVPLRGSSSKN